MNDTVIYLKKATPYMLRNDGKLFSCGAYHPYICNIYDIKNDIESLVNERIEELYWFFTHTQNKTARDYTQIIIKSAQKQNLIIMHRLADVRVKFALTEDTYLCADFIELESFVNCLNDEMNQEFCRVRVSDRKYGGDSGDIYFRISSVGFNWFDYIWDVVYQNRNNISSVTVVRDGGARDYTESTEFYKINNIRLDHLPLNDFITLPGNPYIESFRCARVLINNAAKQLSEGKFICESYPQSHPRYLHGFYMGQLNEQYKYDLNNILHK